LSGAMLIFSERNKPMDIEISMDSDELHEWVLKFFQAESFEEAESRLYKDTECGAWMKLLHTVDAGPVLSLGSIVEGCEATTGTHTYEYLAEEHEYEQFEEWMKNTIQAIEDEVDEIRNDPDLYDWN